MMNYGTIGQATDDNTAYELCMWVTQATHTHSEYVMLIAFPGAIVVT